MVEFEEERKVSANQKDVPGIGAVVGFAPLTGFTGLLVVGVIAIDREMKGPANIMDVHDDAIHLKKGTMIGCLFHVQNWYYWVDVR